MQADSKKQNLNDSRRHTEEKEARESRIVANTTVMNLKHDISAEICEIPLRFKNLILIQIF